MATAIQRQDEQGRVSAGLAAGGIELRNWAAEIATYPRVVVEARSVDHVVEVLSDPETYPAPVRAHGSNHSTTHCGLADGGTVINMRKLDRIVRIDAEKVTAEAGALYIDVAKALERHNLQFFVNIELGNLTIGSAACTGTKDASMPGEFGQVASYCIGMKIVTPSGEIMEIDESDPDLLVAARSNYGLFGVVVEATFRVQPLQAMHLVHRSFTIDEFEKQLPDLWNQGESMMMYIFPFLGRVSVEFRRYTGDEAAARAIHPPSRYAWRLRNFAWKAAAPGFGYLMEKYVPSNAIRYKVIDAFNRFAGRFLLGGLKGSHTVPTDQMIRYPETSGWTKYTFSIWAFPEDQYVSTLRAYCDWIKDYYARTGWRPNMLHVGYRILQDQNNLFSYTWDTNVMTIDPVSTGKPGWTDFLDAYNEFCSAHGGRPLFNQTRGVTREQSRKAFGERIDRFNEYRKRFDPQDRMLNEFFREVLGA